MSNRRQDESSEPVPNAFPSGKNMTELISDSWPGNVFTAPDPKVSTTDCDNGDLLLPSARVSQSLAVASQLPETNILTSGPKIDTDMTSPVWSENVFLGCFCSMSQRMQVESPLDVMISASLMNRQQDR